MKKFIITAFIATMFISANGIINAENYSTDQLLSYSASSNYEYAGTVKPYKKQGSIKINSGKSFKIYTDGSYYYILIDGEYIRASYNYDMGAYSFYWADKRGTWYFNV